MASFQDLPTEINQKILDFVAGATWKKEGRKGGHVQLGFQLRKKRAGDFASARRLASTCRNLRSAYTSWFFWSWLGVQLGLSPTPAVEKDSLFVSVLHLLQAKHRHLCESCARTCTNKKSYAIEVAPDCYKRFCFSCADGIWDSYEWVRETSLRSPEYLEAAAAESTIRGSNRLNISREQVGFDCCHHR